MVPIRLVWKLKEREVQLHDCSRCLLLLGFSNVCHFPCVWPTALKLGCITNFDVLFLVIRLISLVDEIQFMLISSCHICIGL